MPSFTRTLVGIAPLCNANLTVIFTKHDVKAYDQAGATILKGWRDHGGANDWHFPIVNSDHNSNEDSFFPSDDKLTIVPPPNPPPEPLPPPASPVPDTYWDRIKKHQKRPAGMVQLTYWEQLDQGLVMPTEQNQRRHREMACSSNLNATSSYPCIPPHAFSPPTSSPQATSTYDLSSVSSIVDLHHASAGNPVPSSWFAAIKAGNYKTFPGITLCNAMKHCPSSDATIKGHLKQTRQGLRSTKPKPICSNQFAPLAMQDSPTTAKPHDPSHKPTALPPTNKLYITDFPLAKLYIINTGRFPIQACSGNQYITIAFHSRCNAILCTPYVNRSNKHQLATYDSIMRRLANRGHNVDLQILNNEVSTKFKVTIVDKWKVQYQLVPPDIHCHNAAKQAIQTLKSHFLAIIASQPPAFSRYLWDLLLPPTEPTLNLLCQSYITPSMSAWEHFNGPFDHSATPLLPLGCPLITHNKPATCHIWDFRGSDGLYACISLKHYHCHHVIDGKSKSLRISDTVDFRHHYLTIPTVTSANTIVHSLDAISNAITNAPSTTRDTQLHTISTLCNLFSWWEKPRTSTTITPPILHTTAAHWPTSTPLQQLPPTPIHRPSILPAPHPQQPHDTLRVCPTSPRVASPIPQPKVKFTLAASPRVEAPTSIAHRTCSRTTVDNIYPQATPLSHTPVFSCTRSHTMQSTTPACASSRKYPSSFITHWASSACTINRAASVFDEYTGNFLEWHQLRTHPTFSITWNASYANKLGCLCQGIITGPNKGKHVKGTSTLFPIPFDKIPSDRCREITYSKIVCKVQPEKGDDANHTRITIGGNNIAYPGDVGTPTGSIELSELLVNSVLSQCKARLATMDLKNFYLNTPLDRPEYIHIKLADIPQEFINEYKLKELACDSWIYFEMCRGMYGLPQAGILANKLLGDRLAEFNYYEEATTPRLWHHKWCPVMFALIVNNFAIQYIGDAHLDHLCQALKKHYKVSEEIDGTHFAGMTLKWNYQIHAKCSCCLSIPDYIFNVCTRYKHPMPTKHQLSPHKYHEIIFGQTTQLTHVNPYSPPLSTEGVKRIQGIFGALLYYKCAVNNTLLATLSTLISQQVTATEATNVAMKQLLDYLAMYPDNGTTYCASDMILCAHANTGIHNESKGRSQAGAHIFVSKNNPFPKKHNSPVLSISQIMKFVVSSAAEAKLGTLYTKAKEMVALHQTLIEMGWPQPRMPIQMDNSTAVGITNLTIVPKKTKSMDLCLWWLHCRESHQQFFYYWDKGSHNLEDYHTKHHPPIYH
jgi:hypothetical protein